MVSINIFFTAFLQFFAISFAKNVHINLEDSPFSIVFAPESKMFLTGSTNINSYNCNCNSLKLNNPISLTYKSERAQFKYFSLDIKTSDINCHHFFYNHNLKKSLQVDQYPNINIKLLEAWKVEQTLPINETKWSKVIAKTKINIKEISRIEEVNAMAIRISDKIYRIKGNQNLSMADYNVKTPEILFGMVRLEDKIVIHFDLVFAVME